MDRHRLAGNSQKFLSFSSRIFSSELAIRTNLREADKFGRAHASVPFSHGEAACTCRMISALDPLPYRSGLGSFRRFTSLWCPSIFLRDREYGRYQLSYTWMSSTVYERDHWCLQSLFDTCRPSKIYALCSPPLRPTGLQNSRKESSVFRSACTPVWFE